MKNISTALKAHIRSEVTTVCVCISIKRRDGSVFGLTDHDEAVTIAGQRFLPFDSFARTSIANTAALEVDSLEIDGILNSTAVARADIASGLFDFAECSVVLVNYAAPDDGVLGLRTGWIGEIEMTEDGVFHAEVRGLSQVFAYRVGKPYAPECDADLGDKRCTISLDPDFWLPATPYRQGQSVLGHITSPIHAVNADILNARFAEQTDGDLLRNPGDWVSYGGIDGRWNFRSSWHSLNGPPDGSLFAAVTQAVGTSDVHELGMTQDIDLVGSGLTTGDIDTGTCQTVLTAWVACMTADSKVRMRLWAIDAAGGIRNIFDSGLHTYALNRWITVRATNVLIPEGTRKVRVDFYGTKKDSVENGAAFGGAQMSFNDPDGTFDSDALSDGVMFQAQTSGVSGSTEPTFGVTLGATYVDGGITWKCVASFKDVSTVTSVTSQQVIVATLPQAAGYYDGGLLIWETGLNAGKSTEVKTWDGSTLSFFARQFLPIQSADRFVIHPGCDKRRTTCVTKFANIVNFRGFPDVPGQDAYVQTPNQPQQ